MHVLRHDHIAKYEQDISPSHLLKRSLENSAGLRSFQIRKPIMATKSEEMKIAGLLKALKPVGHDNQILFPP
jgi:hypothetical protein